MINDNSKELEYNFKPDYVFKYLFTNLSTPTRVKLINSIFGIHLEEDSEIIVLNTENIFVNEIDKKIEKSYSDTLLKTSYKRKIHIEFQSTNDKNIGVRIFLYGLEAAKAENSYEDCRIQINIKYTNLLEFSLKDFSDKNLKALSFIYLYRYIKKQSECKTEEDVKYNIPYKVYK